ncbi:histidine phosphatase family protein [Vibrio hyugaensis]|uniref:histidine phosphatase family protein n=1 Tax=Vibrio hyugaensis TaxID=1534743 RepID=UPI000CE485F5|nr:histidine phosphatase family protein [Vibrio hyugaensis]
MIHITFVRHGRSQADDLYVHEGRFDSPLTEVGIQQAEQRAKQFVEEGGQYDAILSSSLQRARHVAEIFSEHLNVNMTTHDELMERDNGPFQGLPFNESANSYPKADFVNPYQPCVVSANEGESGVELYARASLALQSIIRRGSGRYLVVSHGRFLSTMFNVICGNQPRANEAGVRSAFDDLGYVDTTYQPESDVWVIRSVR